MTQTATHLATAREAVGIWLLQYGPCWCRSTPTDGGSFDYVRMRRTLVEPLEENLLIVSEKVIDGTAGIYRQVYDDVPHPKLVISAGTCPFASRFWDELPNGWDRVDEILPIDVHVEDCISGNPEALLAAVLAHRLARPVTSDGAGWLMEEAAIDA